jgi:hypothetical protein
MHEIQYNDDILDKRAEALWQEYGDDIIEYIVGYFGQNTSNHITEDAEISSGNPITEYAWFILMSEAMQANAESLFDADGPCDIYGELI